MRTGAATGRHMTIIGIKSGKQDNRPSFEERLKSDSHLKTLQTKAPTKNNFNFSFLSKK